jgi:prolyl 4-hydroxylase
VGDAEYSACAQQGVAVKPRKGDALLFYDLLETGRPDFASRHQGCPVARGEKWTATKRILVNRRPSGQLPAAKGTVFAHERGMALDR